MYISESLRSISAPCAIFLHSEGGWLRFDGSIRTEHKAHNLVKQSATGGEERVFPAVLLICGSVSHLPIPVGGLKVRKTRMRRKRIES
jgi:hypothetical protein